MSNKTTSQDDAREDLIEALYAASVPDPQRIRETWADAILTSGWVADLREEEAQRIATALDKAAEDAGPHYVYGLREAARIIREDDGLVPEWIAGRSARDRREEEYHAAYRRDRMQDGEPTP